MAYHSFEDLDVWKDSCRLAVSINELFRDSSHYAMRDQILRSAISIPSNIAEGSERNTPKDTARFLHIAKGSSAELRTQIYLSQKMNLLTTEQAQPLSLQAKKISAQLQKLIQTLNPKT